MADFIDDFRSKAPPLMAPDDPMDYTDVFAPQLLDQTAPVVTVVSPAPGQYIPRNVAFVVDVTDDRGAPKVALYAEFRSSRLCELVRKLDRFTFRYESLSTVEAIPNGYRFTFRREGGWPSAPTFGVLAFDGNAA